MERGCIIQVDLPQDSPYGESYQIITDPGMTFEIFQKLCNQTGCIPHDDGVLDTEYIPLHHIVRYYEIREN